MSIERKVDLTLRQQIMGIERKVDQDSEEIMGVGQRVEQKLWRKIMGIEQKVDLTLRQQIMGIE